MTRHIGERTLARFGQGDLSARRSARIRAHLDECASCRELKEDLAGVTTLLADVHAPPMPEHLSARIQTALSAEAAKRAALTATAGNAGAESAGAAAPDAPASRPGVGSPRHEGRQAHRRRQPRAFRLSSPVALRTMAATAAAVVLAAGGYEIVAHTGGSGASSSTPSGVSGSAATTPPVAGPMHAASGAVPAPQLHYRHAGRQGSVTVLQTDTNYEPATLSGLVSQELQNPVAPTGRAGGSEHSNTFGPGATVGGIPVSRLQGCVSRVAAGQQVLLVDVARYRGTPATVIVTRGSPGSPEQIWVVGTGCSDASSDVVTQMTLAAAG